MKIVLEAFGGKMKSDLLDWPEDAGSHIYMILDMPKFKVGVRGFGWDGMVPDTITIKKCEFEWTGHWYYIGGYSAKRYVLVGIS